MRPRSPSILHKLVSTSSRESLSRSPSPRAFRPTAPREVSRPRDIDVFLTGYPGASNDPNLTANIDFYSNRGSCQPDGLRYEEWMRKYERDLDALEDNHGYIQWLFPIPERGVNHLAQPLQPHEIESMASSEEILKRLMRSYQMMLSFYGISYNDGHLTRSTDYRARFLNLSAHPHNLLRITRILKMLSLFPSLQPKCAPLVLFFVAQHSEGALNFGSNTMAGDSLDKWWSNCFRDGDERKEVRRIVGRRGERGEGAWGTKEYDQWLEEKGRK